MSDENIYIFVPNLIGYVRVILALIAFYYMPTDCVMATSCYIISGLLDAVDGHAARMLNQSSRFGALLDMVTDRCATMCLLVVLCLFYPAYTFLFQLSMIIDIASHWIHVQSSLMKGIDSHKKMDLSANPILRHYYNNKKVLFLACAGNELFYSMLYLMHFTPGPMLPLGPLSFGLWTLICIICAPIAFAKTGVSLVQLYAACENVTSLDIEERKAKAEKQK
ncbi:hypothetical protein LSH36_15g03061 [Paralvinella palmiformis]|uniref:CDP-diacylglycerol--inositol 3-phosphatidyltransferase n=1 Tax=Paralvinella palmiformis TaxID=53620 RepID=A0AAD9NHN2_9ANNE|nr:hypothetical protein LSH36_15g03061 [Paralvinella palmiformis]